MRCFVKDGIVGVICFVQGDGIGVRCLFRMAGSA